MTALLELNNIHRSYPSGDGPVDVLKGSPCAWKREKWWRLSGRLAPVNPRL
jgi:hypothetical protein